jgi:hypothetical protein
MSYKCPECNKYYYDDDDDSYYCKPCNSGHFRDNFQKWTSGDDDIDNLIRESQLNASRNWEFLEWIEYSNLKNIEHVAEGGFGNVYKAIWENGPIRDRYDQIKQAWIREGETTVAVKKYRNAMNMSAEFLNEVNKIKMIN